jgi:hypothetical protein
MYVWLLYVKLIYQGITAGYFTENLKIIASFICNYYKYVVNNNIAGGHFYKSIRELLISQMIRFIHIAYSSALQINYIVSFFNNISLNNLIYKLLNCGDITRLSTRQNRKWCRLGLVELQLLNNNRPPLLWLIVNRS